MHKWNVYIIYNGNYSYVGMTNNLKQRIQDAEAAEKGEYI